MALMRIASIFACNRVASHVDLKTADGALHVYKLVIGHITQAKFIRR